MRLLATMAVLTTLLASARAHSWVEQLSLVANDGNFLRAPGYPRGNVPRASPSFNDAAMTYLLPPHGRNPSALLYTDNICLPSQQNSVQTAGSPALQAWNGAQVAFRYQENGHVTFPGSPPGKPAGGGVISIYDTAQPRPGDTLNSIHGVWNADGTSGDRRGKLLGQQNFDDWRCFQINSSPISQYRQQHSGHPPDPTQGSDLWCHNVITFPEGLARGSLYTLY